MIKENITFVGGIFNHIPEIGIRWQYLYMPLLCMLH